MPVAPVPAVEQLRVDASGLSCTSVNIVGQVIVHLFGMLQYRIIYIGAGNCNPGIDIRILFLLEPYKVNLFWRHIIFFQWIWSHCLFFHSFLTCQTRSQLDLRWGDHVVPLCVLDTGCPDLLHSVFRAFSHNCMVHNPQATACCSQTPEHSCSCECSCS